MAARRIGILTGGGDVPGLNSVIKSVVYNATEIGCEVIGIRRGWEGLTHMKRPSSCFPRAADSTRTTSARSTGSTRARSTEPAARCCTRRARTPRRCRPADCPRSPAERARHHADQRRRVRPDAARARQHRVPGPRLPRHDRRRRHAVLLRDARPRRHPAHRHPQDDGQRRPGHRVLHRLLDRRSPAPRRRSTGSARRSARTSASACSASSAATRASPRCTRRT